MKFAGSNTEVTKQAVLSRLSERGFSCAELQIGEGASVIVSSRGGRILGPFLGDDHPGLMWINECFAGADSFGRFIDSGEWNLGGERIWLAPEIQYNVGDRTRFFETYSVPSQVDPGAYKLQSTPGSCRLSQSMSLETFNPPRGRKQLSITRTILPAENPFRSLSAASGLMSGVIYCGYEHRIDLGEEQNDTLMSEAWSLVQMRAGGDVVIPTTSTAETTSYYEAVDERLMTTSTRAVRLRITADRKYKYGFKALHLLGRYGYANLQDPDRSFLLVRCLFNNPSAPYAEGPAHTPSNIGHSLSVYNDDGELGAFGELECNAQPIGGSSGRSRGMERMYLWCFVGPLDSVRRISKSLLGVDAAPETH